MGVFCALPRTSIRVSRLLLDALEQPYPLHYLQASGLALLDHPLGGLPSAPVIAVNIPKKLKRGTLLSTFAPSLVTTYFSSTPAEATMILFGILTPLSACL